MKSLVKGYKESKNKSTYKNIKQ